MAKTRRRENPVLANLKMDMNMEIWPVTKQDKWCMFRKDKDTPEAPYGYVLQIPLVEKNTVLKGLQGRIIRSKKKGSTLLLQVINREDLKERPEYGISSECARETLKRKRGRKKKNHNKKILNIRNLSKNML